MNRRAFAVAAGVVLARPAAAVAQVGREAEILTGALRIEHVTVFAYDAVLRSGLLAGEALALARRLRGHESEHAAAFARALGDIGFALPDPPERVADVEVPAVRSGLSALDDRAAALTLLADLERLSLDAHRAALTRLRDGRFLQLTATVLAAEAQHAVAWRTVR